MELFLTPGFGWASKRSAAKERVVLFSESKLLKEGDFCFGEGEKIIFESLSPGELLCASSGESATTPNNPVKIASTIEKAINDYCISNTVYRDDIIEIISNNHRSNGRELKWNIMSIAPNEQFQLHAHPNLELIWVVRGAMHEYRLSTALPLPKREFALGDNAGPDLSALSAEKSFVYRKVSAACQPVEESSTSSNLTSSFIFNEKGSVHISFTREEEALLLVLWSGSHATLQQHQLPIDHLAVFT